MQRTRTHIPATRQLQTTPAWRRTAPCNERTSTGVPRYLQRAPSKANSVAVQRDGDGTATTFPRLQLSTPSLLQPSDPYARFRPDLGLHLHLDEQLQAQMLAQAWMALDPARLAGLLGATGAAQSSTSTGGATGPGSVAQPAPGVAPSPTPGGSSAKIPSVDPDFVTTPRAAAGGDVLSAMLKTPAVTTLLNSVRDRALSDLKRHWSGATTGEKIGFVSGSAFVAASIVGPLLAAKESRDTILPLLYDTVIPIPGVDGYGVEFSLGDKGVTVGAHLDVGQFLPKSLGFGPASLKSFNDPAANALPPVSRAAQDGTPLREAPATGIGVSIAAARGAGSALPASERAAFAPALAEGLGDVRIHADAQADALARGLQARAFTAGQDIFFRAGAYDPASREGRRLLAHELAHTVQQARGPVDGDEVGEGLKVSAPGDRHEREADAAAERVAHSAPALRRSGDRLERRASSGWSVQRQPESTPVAKPDSAASAAANAPPQWTDYFDEVVPAILEAAESSDKVGLQKAMWLIVQAYGEQSPRVGLPHEHRNRLFNEQAAVEFENGKIKRVLPNQESEGVTLRSLSQNEAPKRGEVKMKSSPTFGYDTPERAAHHHLEQMRSRWGSAYSALTADKGSFEQFARALRSSGYAKAEDYDTALIGLQNQVRGQVAAWLKFRIPELRDARIPANEQYVLCLRATHAVWVTLAQQEADPAGESHAQAQWLAGQIDGAERVLSDARAQLGRLERFAGALKLKT